MKRESSKNQYNIQWENKMLKYEKKALVIFLKDSLIRNEKLIKELSKIFN